MKKWILAAFTVMGTVAAIFAVPAPAQAAPTWCDGTIEDQVIDGNVRVAAGDSCILINTTVNGNFMALDGAEIIKIFNSPVLHNIHIIGSTKSVKIGVQGCGFDPTVGNNIIVADSHNVGICQMTVDNNIMVRGNDGRIRVSDNVAGNNIMVNDNLAYDPLPGEPAGPQPILLRNNTAGNHIFVLRNDRDLVESGNVPEPRVS